MYPRYKCRNIFYVFGIDMTETAADMQKGLSFNKFKPTKRT